MKLIVKTLDQKTYQVELDDRRTVLDLKKHLYRIEKLNILPNRQQLIYSGRVLNDEDVLKRHCIDERKFLVVMMKRPQTTLPSPKQSNATVIDPLQKSPKRRKLRKKCDKMSCDGEASPESNENISLKKEKAKGQNEKNKNKTKMKEDNENKKNMKTKQSSKKKDIQIQNEKENKLKKTGKPPRVVKVAVLPHMFHKHSLKMRSNGLLRVPKKERQKLKPLTLGKTTNQKPHFCFSANSHTSQTPNIRKEERTLSRAPREPTASSKTPSKTRELQSANNTPLICDNSRRCPKHKQWMHELAQEYAADVFATQVAIDSRDKNVGTKRVSNQPPIAGCCQKFLQQLVSMGYDEADASRALITSLNNPDHAIANFIESVPNATNGLRSHTTETRSHFYNPLAFLYTLPSFKHMRFLVQERPDLLNKVLAKIGSVNPALFEMIKDNKEEFLDLINDRSHELSYLHVNCENFEGLRTTLNDQRAIERLARLGFGRTIAMQTYMACDRNEELAAECLCRYLNE